MLTKFHTSSKRNPCPICNRTKDADCRISQNGELVLCHTEINGRVKGDALNGFIWIGQTEDEMWGKWIIPSAEPRKDPTYRPTGKRFEFRYTNKDGLVICTKVRQYQRQPDGSVKKTDRWSPSGVDSDLLLPYRYLEAITAIKKDASLPLFVDESEMTADELWRLGIPAIAFGRSIKDARIKQLLSGYESRLVVCTDQDKAGVKKAERYLKLFPMARQLKPYPESDFWEPEWLPESGGLDVRDWILEGNLSREQVLGAVEKHDVIADSTVETGEGDGKPHFESDPLKGLYWISYEKNDDGEYAPSRTRIGNHLAAIAYLNSPDNDEATILLEFSTQQNKLVRWSMPRRALGGDKTAIVGELLARGYGVAFEQTRKLTRYLTELGEGIEPTYVISQRTGWVSGSFLLPDRTIGNQNIRFSDVEPQPDSPTEVKGTLDDWIGSVGKLCAGNSRLIFALGCALAAPLLEPLGIESGGFHLVGASSTGKTTTLNVAASVAGHRKLTQWNATGNGLEAVAEAHNHLLLPLDEIGQCHPRDVAQASYLLANGAGKQRMSKTLQTRKPKEWRLLFLSSGEIGLGQCLKEGGINLKSGQEARMPDVPAIPSGQSFGAFENIHDYESPSKFVAALESACQQNHGSPLDAFVSRLDLSEDAIAKLNRDLWSKTQALIGEISDEVIGRAAKRFALVWLAIELAHGYGLLPFRIEQCGWAVQTVFADWIAHRGGAGSVEIKAALQRIEHEFVTAEFSDRILNLDERQDSPIRNLLAYQKDDLTGNSEFWVPGSVFRQLCQGVDQGALIAEMLRLRWLKPATEPERNTLQRKLNNRKIRVFVFNHFWNCEILPGTPGTPGTKGQNVDVEGDSGVPTNEKSPGTDWVRRVPGGDESMQEQLSIEKSLGRVPGVPGNEKPPGTENQNQNPLTERVSSRVPGVPGVPSEKHDLPKNGTSDFDDEEIDF